jgi:MFS family permease
VRLLATSSTAAGLLQFLLNPSLGKLSDTYGRKLFMMIGPYFNVLSNAMIALFPSSFWNFAFFRTLDDVVTTLSGSTTSSAAISDCASGQGLAIAMSRLGTYIGLGVMLGPVIGDTIFAQYGFRMVYASKAIVAAAHALFVTLVLPETLPIGQRKPFRFELVLNRHHGCNALLY